MPSAVRDKERKARLDTWARLDQAGRVRMQELQPATLRELNNYLETAPPVDVIHFFGHGDYVGNQGILWFDSDHHSGGEPLRADQVATALDSIPLVVLHACRSAMSGKRDLLTGVAPALCAAGVPAVIGMQLTIDADLATRFASVLYEALTQGESLQRAMGRGRKVLYTEDGTGVAWYVPTLTMRSSESLYFV